MNEKAAERAGATRRRKELNRRLRAAFLAGAEERSRREHGRGLSEAELRRIIERYPGDIGEQ